MRFSIWIKLVAFWLLPIVDCYGQPLPKSYLEQAKMALVYDVSLTFRENHLSGIAVVKNETDGSHLVILSKFGLTLIDVVLGPDGTHWRQKPPGLDQPARLLALEREFRLLLLTPLTDPKKWKVRKKNQFIVKDNFRLRVEVEPVLQRVVRASIRQFPFKSEAYYVYLSDEKLPSEICLNRRLPRLTIRLTKTNSQ